MAEYVYLMTKVLVSASSSFLLFMPLWVLLSLRKVWIFVFFWGFSLQCWPVGSRNEDNFVVKPPKRTSPLLYRTIVLIFAMMCGLYICSICLKQINGKSRIIENVRVMGLPCCNRSLVNLDFPWLHYPRPETFSRAECAQNPVHFFAILSIQRSGSGWFETLLNSHTNVSSNGEIFSVRGRRKNASSILQTLDQVYNLDWYSSASKNECSAAIGFKWMLNQGVMEHPQEIVEYFNRRGISAIFLFRRNLLRRMISELANSYDRRAKLLNGIHKSHVHSAEEANMLSKYKPTINSTSLMTNMIEVKSKVAKVLAFFNSTRHIVLFYEDIVKNRTRLRDVQYFLGLPLMNLTSRQVKIHRGPVSELISNWDEVYRTLNGTDYERFTHSDY